MKQGNEVLTEKETECLVSDFFENYEATLTGLYT